MNNYRFNDGNGAVLCADCLTIIATGITPQEAEYYYPEGTLCGECLSTLPTIKEQREKLVLSIIEKHLASNGVELHHDIESSAAKEIVEMLCGDRP